MGSSRPAAANPAQPYRLECPAGSQEPFPQLNRKSGPNRRPGQVGSTARRRAGLFGRGFPRRRPPNRTCDFHRIRLSMSTSGGLPTRAACAGSGVPAPAPHRRRGTARPCSPATSSRPTMPRTHWTPSPCGRLSRPPRWVVTPTTTTGPPPRPVGNSGPCACPEPEGPAGTAGTLPTFTINRSAGSAPSSTPGASPRSTATRRAASPARSASERTRRSRPATRTKHPNSP